MSRALRAFWLGCILLWLPGSTNEAPRAHRCQTRARSHVREAVQLLRVSTWPARLLTAVAATAGVHTLGQAAAVYDLEAVMISTRSATETRARIGLEGDGARSAARRIDRSALRAPRARRAHRARRLGGEDDLLLRKHAQNSAGEPSRRSSTRRAALRPQSGSRSGSPTSATGSRRPRRRPSAWRR